MCFAQNGDFFKQKYNMDFFYISKILTEYCIIWIEVESFYGFPCIQAQTQTLGASNLILAFPLTRVAQICIITASIVYTELQP